MKTSQILTTCSLVMLSIGCSKKPVKEARPIPRVRVEKAQVKDIPLFVKGIGHIVAYYNAEIRAQVEGVLEEYYFEEGDDVKEGQLLYKIDPNPYQATLDQSVASYNMHKAKHKYAKEKFERYEPLKCENYVAKLDLIKYETDMDFHAAEMDKDAADILSAEIDLNYCFIRAPFDGVTGKRLLDIGNLIENAGTPLLVLNQIDQVYIDFSIPEKYIMKLLTFHQPNAGKPLKVEISFQEYPNKTFESDLVLIDNQIRTNTGMIPLRAQICNPSRLFWPGQFVSAKVVLTHIKGAVMIPEQAVNYGQDRKFVYIVGHNNIAEMRDIETGELLDHQVEIISGVKEGETVIYGGQINVLPNKEVSIAGTDTEGKE